MTSLRTAWGLDLQRVEMEWSAENADRLRSEITQLLPGGKLRLERDVATLTDEGKLFADGIAAELFCEE